MTPGHPNGSDSTGQQSGRSIVSEWETRPLGELIRHVVERHHAWLRNELPETGQLIHRVNWTEGRQRSGTLPELEKLFRRFQREIEDHLKKEEAILFPIIERLEHASASGAPAERHLFGSIENPVHFMMEDHELANRLLAKMKELAIQTQSGEPPPAARQSIFDRLEAIEGDLAIHSQLEDEVLFPRAIRLEKVGTTAGV
jgi:regulator of cell morphogenesis and NO signaling